MASTGSAAPAPSPSIEQAAAPTSGSPSANQNAQGAMTSQPASHNSGPLPPPSTGPNSTPPTNHTPTRSNAGAAPPARDIKSFQQGESNPSPASRSASLPSDEKQPGGSSGPSKETRELHKDSKYHEVSDLIKLADPSVLRQALRDNWERCFLGSDYHTAFLLNAVLHQAPPTTLCRSVQDFGKRMVQYSSAQLLEHFGAADIDKVADLILSRASPHFLDRALAHRLETIDARSLVNALARAERLGYDVQDIVEEKTGNGTEHVIPSMGGMQTQQYQSPSPTQHPGYSSQPQQYQQYQQYPPQTGHDVHAHGGHHQAAGSGHFLSRSAPALQPKPPPPPPKAPPGITYCHSCGRPCSGKFALAYHLRKGACDPSFDMRKLGKNICYHCGCTFGSGTGIIYHQKSGVCGHYSQAQTDVVVEELKLYLDRVAAAQAQPYQHHQQVPPPSSTPNRPSFSSTPTSTPTTSQTPKGQGQGDDPYVHLDRATRGKYEHEMTMSEQHFGKLMQDALKLPEPERIDQFAKLKNRYNTKQSTTRKKYGIRLREKRTKEDIDAERVRLLGPNGADIWMDMEHRAKRKPGDGSLGSSYQAVNVNSPHNKPSQPEIGGLSGSAGPAATTDPTSQMTSSQPRDMARLYQMQSTDPQPSAVGGSRDDPMDVDKDSETEPQAATNGGSSGDPSSDSDQSSNGDGDIPAQ